MACTAPLQAVAPIGARKTVTVVFSDLAGSTALGEALDSEYLREGQSQDHETTVLARP
jgi:class 3 adenylate cyclase